MVPRHVVLVLEAQYRDYVRAQGASSGKDHSFGVECRVVKFSRQCRVNKIRPALLMLGHQHGAKGGWHRDAVLLHNRALPHLPIGGGTPIGVHEHREIHSPLDTEDDRQMTRRVDGPS